MASSVLERSLKKLGEQDVNKHMKIKHIPKSIELYYRGRNSFEYDWTWKGALITDKNAMEVLLELFEKIRFQGWDFRINNKNKSVEILSGDTLAMGMNFNEWLVVPIVDNPKGILVPCLYHFLNEENMYRIFMRTK